MSIHWSGKYPAKLLLFGEHILLKGAQAMAVPVPAFYGEWRQGDILHPHEQWRQLKTVADGFDPTLPIDFQRLRTDIATGIFFFSNIPQGYGLGSSGALCAAVYDRYVLGAPETDLSALKNILGGMESCFHGKSSGIDPLTSYLQKPLLIKNNNEINILPGLVIPDGISLFLADSGQQRQTGGLVNWFLEQYNHPAFSSTLENHIFPAHQAMLTAWLIGDTRQFMLHLQTISRWQLDQLKPMLPVQPDLLRWWETGIMEGKTILKICGAGGGGYILGFTTDAQNTLQMAEKIDIPLVFPFNISA